LPAADTPVFLHLALSRCAPARPCRQVGITRAVIAGVIRPDCRRARTGREFLAEVEKHMAEQHRRSDYRHRVMHVVEIYAARMRPDGTAWATRDEITRQTAGCPVCGGLTPDGVKTYVRYLREAGLLPTVREGTTPAIERNRRAGTGQPVPDHNLAAVRVLCVRRQEPLRTCPDQRQRLTPPHALKTLTTRGIFHPSARESAKGTGVDRPEILKQGALRLVTDGWLAIETRDFRAGAPGVDPWTADDLRKAINQDRTGRQDWHTDDVRSPAKWLRYRLNFWRDQDGKPVPSPSQEARERARTAHAEMIRHRAERAALVAARSADYTGQAARARDLLNAALARATQIRRYVST
jgi:hypothetical protein